MAMDNRGCTLMSNDFTATWLERKIPYSSMYTSDFDQKYPKASNLPSGTEKLQKRNWETAFYGHGVEQKPSETYGDGWDSTQPIFGYASTYRADFTGTPILPRTFNNMNKTKNRACLADHAVNLEKSISQLFSLSGPSKPTNITRTNALRTLSRADGSVQTMVSGKPI